MKVNSRVYKGIEFIQLTDLPQDQQLQLTEALNEELFIKILIDKSILNNCVQYKDYERWFETQYRPEMQPARVERQIDIAPAKMILGKA